MGELEPERTGGVIHHRRWKRKETTGALLRVGLSMLLDALRDRARWLAPSLRRFVYKHRERNAEGQLARDSNVIRDSRLRNSEEELWE